MNNLTKIHVQEKSERGVLFARCGYFKAIDYREPNGDQEGINPSVRVFQHFVKKWPQLKCTECAGTIEEEQETGPAAC